jgi:agmatine/peptidylarginine deiminase
VKTPIQLDEADVIIRNEGLVAQANDLDAKIVALGGTVPQRKVASDATDKVEKMELMEAHCAKLQVDLRYLEGGSAATHANGEKLNATERCRLANNKPGRAKEQAIVAELLQGKINATEACRQIRELNKP